MQNLLHQVGLNWSTLFFSPDDNFNEKAIKDGLKNFKSCLAGHRPEPAPSPWLPLYMTTDQSSVPDELLVQACERVALKFCLKDTTFARDISFSGKPDELERALNVFDRKQYKAKILQKLLNDFLFLLQLYGNLSKIKSRLPDLFIIEIQDELQNAYAEKVTKEFAPLKELVDKVASGVKPECYLNTPKFDAIKHDPYVKEFTQYVLHAYQYDCKQIRDNVTLDTGTFVFLPLDIGNFEPALQHFLLDDEQFWKIHPDFNVLSFIRNVAVYNDPTHARKLVDHIFKVAQSDPFASELLKAQLPLSYAVVQNQFSPLMEENTKKWAFDRFTREPQYKKITGPFCYPLSPIENAKEKLEIGQQIFESFLKEYVYPDHFETVWNYMKSNLQTTNQCGHTLGSILDKFTFGCVEADMDMQAVKLLCPSYFDDDHILNRVYLKAYAIKKAYPKDQVYPHLFEMFFPVFEVIEDELQIQTAMQTNLEGREKIFSSLSDILKQHGITCSESHKQDYIISLLDRKVALMHEADRFPVLEQSGDAIYGLAVAELMFYNPEASEDNFSDTYETYISAATQVKLAAHLKLDDLYLNASAVSLKYDDSIMHFSYDQCPDVRSCILPEDQKYLADSLEMIIGTIYLDHGIITALSFTKKLLQETMPQDFPDEVRYSPDKINTSDIDPDYWSTILPAPVSQFESSKQYVMHNAFYKALGALCIGTDSKEKRRFITIPGNVTNLCDQVQFGRVDPIFYEYLQSGFENTVKVESEQILTKYQSRGKKL